MRGNEGRERGKGNSRTCMKTCEEEKTNSLAIDYAWVEREENRIMTPKRTGDNEEVRGKDRSGHHRRTEENRTAE